MATVTTCDGCEAIQGSDLFAEIGYVAQKQYCSVCEVSIRDFMLARDRLHTSIAEEWQTQFEMLKDEWHIKHPDGRLPDE